MIGYTLIAAGVARLIEVVFIRSHYLSGDDTDSIPRGLTLSEKAVDSKAGNEKFGQAFLHLAPLVSSIERL